MAQTLKNTEWELSCCTGDFNGGFVEDTVLLGYNAVSVSKKFPNFSVILMPSSLWTTAQ